MPPKPERTRQAPTLAGALVLAMVLALADPTAAAQQREPTPLPSRPVTRGVAGSGAPAAPPTNGPAPATGTAPASGLAFSSEDGQYQVRANFWMQALGRFALGDESAALSDTFSLRRVRPRIEGTLFGRVDFLFMLEAGGEGRIALFDAFADIRIVPELRIRFGRQKVPFSLDRLQGFPVLPMVERTFSAMVGPNRDLGIDVWGEVLGGALVYHVGLFNGVADGQNGAEDLEDSKDVIGRLFLRPFHTNVDSPLRRLGVGGAASYGRTGGIDGDAGSAGLEVPTYTTPGRARMFAYRGPSSSDGVRTSAVFASGERQRLELDGYWYWDRFSVFAELIQTRNAYRAPGGRDTLASTVTAWNVMLAVVLTDDTSSYERGVEPHAPLDPSRGHWGALELVARVQRFHVDDAAFPRLASRDSNVSDALNLGFCVNWAWNQHLRLQLDFERTMFRDGAINGDRETENLALLQLTLRT